MDFNKILFWNVDTQYDFMRDDETFRGALPVPGAREIEPNLEKITEYAKKNGIKVINTADFHTSESKEISDNPDYSKTFPRHCMKLTKGLDYIPQTNPENPYIIGWEEESFNSAKLRNSRNIILYKDSFDIFEREYVPRAILKILNPEKVFVYGVSTNVCVDYAVKGLLKENLETYVFTDAIKEFSSVSPKKFLEKWKKKGVHLIKTGDIISQE